MNKEGFLYFGVWFQRTSLHLKEVYNFLKFGSHSDSLNKEELQNIRSNLSINSVNFVDDGEFDFVQAKSGSIDITITEDGITMLKSKLSDLKTNIDNLSSYYSNHLGKALSFLFSLGAPIPKNLSVIEDAYPFYIVGHRIDKDFCESVFNQFGERIISIDKRRDCDIYTSSKIVIINYHLKLDNPLIADELIRNIIILREFERQLSIYLDKHREIWDNIRSIRNSSNIRYRDFPSIRSGLLRTQEEILFVKARLAQMIDILSVRKNSINPDVKKRLEYLSLLDRFRLLEANHKYIHHLWEMTSDYTKSTLTLLDSLYSENTQIELNAIKFLTILNIVASFTRMSFFAKLIVDYPPIFSNFFFILFEIAVIGSLVFFLIRYSVKRRRFITLQDNK